jgi:hypothetical protein
MSPFSFCIFSTLEQTPQKSGNAQARSFDFIAENPPKDKGNIES